MNIKSGARATTKTATTTKFEEKKQTNIYVQKLNGSNVFVVEKDAVI